MQEFYHQFSSTYIAIVSRYIFLSLVVFVALYWLFKQHVGYRKIQLKFPKNKDYVRELMYSLVAVLFMAFSSAAFFVEPMVQYSKIYRDFSEMPLWYTLLTFPIMMLMHDAFFYWMHRFLHHPKIYKKAHLVHHKSTNPSPWAAYSFHPIEAFLESLIGPIIIVLLPTHITVFIAFFIFQIVYNIYGHSGFEIYPKGFQNHWLGKWINTSIHHNLHHKYFDNSYGLYFTFWDRLMGTMSPKYDETFDEVTSRVKPKERSRERDSVPQAQKHF